MKCINCGADMPENAVFCANCGSRTVDVANNVASTCANCQNPLKPGALFCGVCGTKTGATPAPAATQYTPPVYAMPNPPAPAPRRKKKGALVAIVVILVIALVCVGVYAFVPGVGATVNKALLGTKGYYAYVEGKELKQNTSDLIGDVGQYTNTADKGGYNVEFKVDLDETALGLDAEMAAIYENLTLKNRLLYNRTGDVTKMFDQLDLTTGDEVLLSAQGLIDSDQMLVGLPDILPKYISATSEELLALMSQSGVDTSVLDPAMFSGAGSFDFSFNEAALKNTFSKMIDIMLKHVDKCEMTAGQTLTAGEISAKYDCYTMTIEKESARLMLIEIMEMLQKDDEIFKLYNQTAVSSGAGELAREDYEADLQVSIDQLNDTENDTSADFTIEQKVYININQEVVGRDLTITSAGATMMSFQYAHPVSGNKEAVSYLIDTGTGAIEYLSEYTVTGGKKTGGATFGVDGVTMATIDFENVFEQRIGSKDFTLGKFTLTIVDESSLSSGMPTEINYEAKADGNVFVMDLSIAGIGSLNIRYSEIAANDATIPDLSDVDTVSITDDAGISELMTEDVMQKFAELADRLGLSAAIPSY